MSTPNRIWSLGRPPPGRPPVRACRWRQTRKSPGRPTGDGDTEGGISFLRKEAPTEPITDLAVIGYGLTPPFGGRGGNNLQRDRNCGRFYLSGTRSGGCAASFCGMVCQLTQGDGLKQWGRK